MISSFKSFGNLYSKVWRLARPYGRKKPLVVLIVVIAQGIFQVAGVTSIFPFLALASDPAAFRNSNLGARITAFLPPLSDSQLLILAGVFAITTIALANLTNFMSDFVRARYAHGLGHWLRGRLLGEMAAKPWSYFLENNTGVLLKKASADVMQMVNGVILPGLDALARVVTAFLLVITLLIVDFWIALSAGAVLLIFYAIIYRLLQHRRALASDRMKSADRGSMREAQQLLGGIKPVRISGTELYFLDRFNRHSREQARVQSVLPLYFQTPKYILEPIAFGGVIVAVLIYAALGRSLQEILPTLGVVALTGYRLLPAAQLFYGQLSIISTNRHAVTEVSEEFEEVLQSRATNERPVSAPSAPTIHIKRALNVNAISFRYPHAAMPVISELSFTLPRNSSLGIIGKTGSGKSTLVDIILGLHQPTSGSITVDDVAITRANMRDWRKIIGYVPQDIFLTDDTIARNIAFGLPDVDIDQDRLRDVAEAAQILKLIENELPRGFDSVVGERGIRLSGGQRQRIGLARALYNEPELLILDEATSALDSVTEAQVMKAINAQQGHITMIIIAHRLSTVEKCDMMLDLTSVSSAIKQ